MNLKSTLAVIGAATSIVFAGQVSADSLPGSRYALERYYKSEISVSEAYLAMEHSKDFRHAKGPKPVMIDVRSLREYASGHPDDAYNVPYPSVTGFTKTLEDGTKVDLIVQDPQKLYDEVYRIVKGNVDTPILTLCRTGQRSVLAGNILANPGLYGINGPAFTHVRNIWEGFVGQPKYAYSGGNILVGDDDNGNLVTYQLDLNNDGALNADFADVHTQTKDANPDKDGWRNFAGLPWTTQIQKPLAYERDRSWYYGLNLTPVD